MSSFAEIFFVALVAQLVVLPGEKVQFIIAGLSARYDPLVVVAAAGSAFAGWTTLEIMFGRALQRALSPLLLDGITAILFLAFAILLLRSAPASASGETTANPETDGGLPTLERLELPGPLQQYSSSLGGFLPIFALMVTGEFGDKTQLVTIGLAIQYGASAAIWFGEMAAILPVSLLNAYFFHTFSHRVNVRKAHIFSAGLFGFFGLDTLLGMITGYSIWEDLVGTLTTVIGSVL
jgi:putative Ca2+/H+ antiporter (TMEM165/GDT1 family)